MKFYDDFDTSSLAAQLTILHGAVTNRFQNQKQSDVEQITVLEVANLLKNTYGAQQLLDQVWRLTKLLLVVPCSSYFGHSGEKFLCIASRKDILESYYSILARLD